MNRSARRKLKHAAARARGIATSLANQRPLSSVDPEGYTENLKLTQAFNRLARAVEAQGLPRPKRQLDLEVTRG